MITITPNTETTPVFIIGCVRSGTTAMMEALRTGADIPGFNEGNVAPLLYALQCTIEKYYGRISPAYLEEKRHFIANLPEEDVINSLANTFSALFSQHNPYPIWLDKTPEGSTMIRTAPLLVKMFPNAKFIFCKRRAIENILSRQRKFIGAPFKNFCIHWAETMEAWLDIRDVISDNVIEIDQRDMATDPERIAQELKKFLQLSDEQQENIAYTLGHKRFQQTRAAQDENYIDIDNTGWNDEEKSIFQVICTPMMEKFGYETHIKTDGNIVPPVCLFFPERNSIGLERVNIIDQPWGFSNTGESELQIHPNAPDEPVAHVRYRDFLLAGHSSFSAELFIANPGSLPIEFMFSIESADTGETIFSDSAIVSAEDTTPWQSNFPPLNGPYHITIGTKMAPESTHNSCAWARWKNPTLR